MAINVTRSFMPPIEEFESLVKGIWQRCVLTNQGPLVNKLEKTLETALKIKNLQYVTNGTIALQLSLAALDINEGEIITTPFSYVATTSAILWQHCKPVFVDIEPDNFTIDVSKIEALITKRTRAIMPVHVFGYACNIEEIELIAKNYNLKVIYDAAHAFASEYKGSSLLSFGDVSCVSFHATKLFHTIEGGACICNNEKAAYNVDLMKRFGHINDQHCMIGINAKQSEFNAAMGLAVFPYLSNIIKERKVISDLYDKLLKGYISRPKKQKDLVYNYAYYPVLFKSETELLKVFDILNKYQIFPRRYFYPSLNTLPYIHKKFSCPVSEDICSRIACLPLYYSLSKDDVYKICSFIVDAI